MRKLKTQAERLERRASNQNLSYASASPKSPTKTKVIIYCGKTRAFQPLTSVVSEWICFAGKEASWSTDKAAQSALSEGKAVAGVPRSHAQQ